MANIVCRNQENDTRLRGTIQWGRGLKSARCEPGLSGGDCVVGGCQWFVAVCWVGALSGRHGVMGRRAGCHGSGWRHRITHPWLDLHHRRRLCIIIIINIIVITRSSAMAKGPRDALVSIVKLSSSGPIVWHYLRDPIRLAVLIQYRSVTE